MVVGVDCENWGEDLHIAFTEYAGGADGDSEERGMGGGAIGG